MTVTQEWQQTKQEAPPQLPDPTHPLDTIMGPHSPGSELAHTVSRIAVAHEIAGIRPPSLRYSAEYISAEANNLAVQRGGSTELPALAGRNAETVEKASVLEAISHEVSLHVLRNITTGEQRSEAHIDWHGVTQSMVAEAAAAPDKQAREKLLLAGTVASQVGGDDGVRIDFLTSVYDRGLQADAAEACAASPLAILHDAPQALWGVAGGTSATHQLYTLDRMVPVFTIEPGRAKDYLTFLAAKHAAAQPPAAGEAAPTAGDLPSSKKLHKDFMTQEQGSDANLQTREHAKQVSTDGEKVAGGLYDQYKIERFALQSLFIRDQAKALFGETDEDLASSSYARHLAAKRGDDTIVGPDDLTNAAQEDYDLLAYNDPLNDEPSAPDNAPPTSDALLAKDMLQLQVDIMATFTELSAPVVARYSVAGPRPKTKEEGIATRFKTVAAQIEEHNQLSRFINLGYHSRSSSEVVGGISHNMTVYENSEDGAAAPQAVHDTLITVIGIAAKYEADTGDTPEPEEILEVVQRNRFALLGAATHNISEFAERMDIADDLVLQRGGSGTLQLGKYDEEGRFIPGLRVSIPGKQSFDMYAAITLGCPALRETHPARPAKTDELKRLVHGSANFIDHVLAASYNEAYARGLLDVSRYQGLAAATEPVPRMPVNT